MIPFFKPDVDIKEYKNDVDDDEFFRKVEMKSGWVGHGGVVSNAVLSGCFIEIIEDINDGYYVPLSGRNDSAMKRYEATQRKRFGVFGFELTEREKIKGVFTSGISMFCIFGFDRNQLYAMQ